MYQASGRTKASGARSTVHQASGTRALRYKLGQRSRRSAAALCCGRNYGALAAMTSMPQQRCHADGDPDSTLRDRSVTAPPPGHGAAMEYRQLGGGVWRTCGHRQRTRSGGHWADTRTTDTALATQASPSVPLSSTSSLIFSLISTRSSQVLHRDCSLSYPWPPHLAITPPALPSLPQPVGVTQPVPPLPAACVTV